MADERNEQGGNDEPKIKVVDRRMLSDDDRAGKGGESTSESTSAAPKLEIIGGGAPPQNRSDETLQEMASDALQEDVLESGPPDVGEPELSEEESRQLREDLEQEQFAAIEQQLGRPLTEQEKNTVRQEMESRAQAITSLDVGPVLLEVLTAMPRYAFVHMGLMPNPYTRLVAKNDLQARLAIDAYAALLEVLKPQIDPNSRKELERVLTDMRTNFVSVTGTPLAGPGGASGGPRIIH